VKYDDPALYSNFIAVGPDRLYLAVTHQEADI